MPQFSAAGRFYLMKVQTDGGGTVVRFVAAGGLLCVVLVAFLLMRCVELPHRDGA
jgi:hypothetical protein